MHGTKGEKPEFYDGIERQDIKVGIISVRNGYCCWDMEEWIDVK